MERRLEFVENLINVNRYPGDTLIKSESVTDHTWCMIGLALEFVPMLNQKFSPVDFDLRDIIVKIVLHDIDEALYCDIPRKFKYDNPTLTNAIKETSNKLLKEKFSSKIYEMIQASTDKSTASGCLVKIFDIAQSGYKMLSEIHLGNSNFEIEICNITDCLVGMKLRVEESTFYPAVKDALIWMCDMFIKDIEDKMYK